MGEVLPMHRIFVHRQELGPKAVSQQDVLNLEGILVQDRRPIVHDADWMFRRDGHANGKLLSHDRLKVEDCRARRG